MKYHVESHWTKFYLWFWNEEQWELPPDFCSYSKKYALAVFFSLFQLILRIPNFLGKIKINGKTLDRHLDIRERWKLGLFFYTIGGFIHGACLLIFFWIKGYSIDIHVYIADAYTQILLIAGFVFLTILTIIILVITIAFTFEFIRESEFASNTNIAYKSFKDKYCPKIHWLDKDDNELHTN